MDTPRPSGQLRLLGAGCLGGDLSAPLAFTAVKAKVGGADPPPPSLQYKVDTSRPSLRTNWTRLVPLPPAGRPSHATPFDNFDKRLPGVETRSLHMTCCV